MITNNEPLSMPEVSGYIAKSEESKDLKKFIKNFRKLNQKDGEELRKKLSELNLMKLKEKDIVKIVDFMPEDQEDLNKIFSDVKLDEDESKKILETVKEFK